MVDIQLDEVIRIASCNIGLLLHIFYLSLMSQRIIDHSIEFHEVMYAYKITIKMSKNERVVLIFRKKMYKTPLQNICIS